MIENVVIIGGSLKETWPDMSVFDRDKTAFIGVDRGTLYGLEADFLLEEAVGDFDSLTEAEFKELKVKIPHIKQSPAEKDYTDMQLGLLTGITKYPEANYYLIGATGGRLDHYLSNLWIPLQDRFMPFIDKIKMVDFQNTVTYFSPGEYTVEKESDKDYLAFVCLTAVSKLSLTDAKYQLSQANFNYPVSLSSNEFVGNTSHFSFSSGIMCVIQSKDKIKRA